MDDSAVDESIRVRGVRPWRLALAAMLLLSALGCTKARDAYLDYKLEDRTDQSFVTDRQALRVVLCGTGTPQGGTGRGQACTLVAAGGKLFLFDAGAGATENLLRFRVPLNDVNRVFITHWHSDHFNGLGELINHGWVWGRSSPMEVFGPPGVTAYAQGVNLAYAEDVAFRHQHFVPDAENATARAHEVAIAAGGQSVRVFDSDGVTIDAYRVAHEPVEPAYGYVVHYRGKKVFISGDTRIDDVYLSAMQSADLVVHEALNVELVHQAAAAMRRVGRAAHAEVAEKVIHYHADTLALARMAQQAKVKHLVLTHLIPAPDDFIARRMFVRGMADEFKGELTLGEDGTDIRL